MINLKDMFNSDKLGRRFKDVAESPRIPWSATISFFEQPDHQRRMMESELHHDRPALAGVIRDFEAIPDIAAFFESSDSHDTVRFRQAVGVLVSVTMALHNWHPDGDKKGSLGTRAKVSPRTTVPGAYRNESSLSVWFSKAARFSPPPARRA